MVKSFQLISFVSVEALIFIVISQFYQVHIQRYMKFWKCQLINILVSMLPDDHFRGFLAVLNFDQRTFLIQNEYITNESH